MKILAVGDMMPGGVLNGTSVAGVSKEILDDLHSVDCVVATLETAVGNEPTFFDEKMKRLGDVIYVEDDDLKRLKKLNIRVVSLANNHFFDLGYDGATHTIELLDQIGVMHCGAGKNLEEASKPAVVMHAGETYAFLAFCDWREEHVGWCPFATESTPGVNPMFDDYVVSEVSKYAKIYDHVIVLPHWGKEYLLWPKPEIVKISKKMLNAGAELIFGSHSHCVQPICQKTNKAVAYSMGNFLFPDRLITKPRSTYYPHPSLDISSLPQTDGYPYVEEPTFKKWKPIARYGMMIFCSLSLNCCSIDCVYTSLTRQNEVVLEKLPSKTKRTLKMINILLEYSPYTFVFHVRMLFSRIYHKILRIIKRPTLLLKNHSKNK